MSEQQRAPNTSQSAAVIMDGRGTRLFCIRKAATGVMHRFFVPVAILFLSACGGGGSENGSSPAVPTADTSPPVITLVGDTAVNVAFKSAYRDPGASAVDDVDGVVDVAVANPVNTLESGVYEIVYTATDVAGNVAEAIRTVTVAPEKVRLTVSYIGESDFVVASGEVLTCDPSTAMCTLEVDIGRTVSLTSSPAAGFNFERWTSCDRVQDMECEVTLSNSRTVFLTTVSTTPVRLQPSVVQLDTTQIAGITRYAEDSGEIEFADGVDLNGVSIGSVLIAAADTNAGPVFARRVVSLRELAAGGTLVVARNAALVEIIAEGTFIATTLVNPARSSNEKGADGESTDLASRNEPRIDLNGTASLVLLNADGVRIAVAVGGTIDPNFELAVDIRPRDGGFLPRLRAWRLLATLDMELLLGLEYEGQIAQIPALSDRWVLPSVLTVPAPTVLGLPVIFEVRPVVEASAELNAMVELGLRPSWTSLSYAAQWTDTAGFVTNLSSGQRDLEPIGFETATGDLTFEIGLGIRGSAELASVAGPFVEAKALTSVSLNIEPQEDCPVSASTRSAVSYTAGGQLSFLTYHTDFELGPLEVGLSTGTPLACDGSITDPAEDPSPAPGLSVIPGENLGELRLSWNSSGSPVSTYSVWRFSGSEEQAIPELVAQTIRENFIDFGLQDETSYCYWVGQGVGPIPANNEFICAETLPEPDLGPVFAPTLLPVDAVSSDTAGLAWTANNELASIAQFTVYDVTSLEEPRLVGTTDDTEIVISGLQSNRTYCFAVAAVASNDISSSLSNVECVVLDPVGAGPAAEGWIPLVDGDPGEPGDGILVESQNVTCSPDCWTVSAFGEVPDFPLASGADGFTVSSYFVDPNNPNRRAEYYPEFQFGEYGPCGFFLGVFNPRIISSPNINGVRGTTLVMSRDYVNQLAENLANSRPQCSDASAENLFISRIRGDGTRRFLADGVYVEIGNDTFLPKTPGSWAAISEADIGLPGDGDVFSGEVSDGRRVFSMETITAFGDASGLTLSVFSVETRPFDASSWTAVLRYVGAPETCQLERSLSSREARPLRGAQGRYTSFDRSLLASQTILLRLSGPAECAGVAIEDLYIAQLFNDGEEYAIDGLFISTAADRFPWYFDLP